ncbi:MAG: RND family transporter [Planctomycetota bacterium]|nr:MAG: RND family transporter [Planctomycetota bacterium]REJ96135.1 MAG: RND family transporter [Planctomycetota bacterium]REK22740.1 MAG: RND family transporter [Planctomycetota bacterium]REK33840.1 MAG: RND family transporter [Planctomycetota bacterium]
MTNDASRSPPVRLVDWLVRRRTALLLFALLTAVLAIAPASRLELNESIESFYAQGDPDLVAWTESKEWFGGDEIIMVAYEKEGLLERENLNELQAFADVFRVDTGPDAVPGINHAATQDLASTLNLDDVAVFQEFSPIARRIIERILRKSLIDFSRSLLIGQQTTRRNEDGEVVESESDATAVMLELAPGLTSEQRQETFHTIREIAADPQSYIGAGETSQPTSANEAARKPFPPVYVAGEPIQIHDMFRYVEEDALVLGWATSGLLLIVILFLFRSVRWVVLPLLVVHVTIVWTRALLVLTGLKLSMVSSMLNSLVTIIGIATVTHVTVTYRELRIEHDRTVAFRETFLRLAPPVFWTCVTTAIGFLALLSSEIVPVQSFGLMVALGALLVLVAAAAILPGGVLIGGLDVDPRSTPAERQIVSGLLGITRWVERHPLPVMGGTAALMMAGGIGLVRLRVETDFSKNFRSSSEIAEAVDFFEAKLGGAGSWEVNFPAPAELDENYLDQVRELAVRLRRIEMDDGTQLTKVYALTDGLDFIPSRLGETIGIRRRVLRQVQPGFEDQLYNPSAGRMRLVLRAQEQKPAEIKLALISEVEQTAREMFPDARATGLYVMIAKLIKSLLADQVKSFTLAAIGIAVCMTIAFRNLWIGIASLLPNVFPILLVIGGMGWLGVPVNIGTAMIACVSMGLTVDSSIHYLSGYRRARQSGLDHVAAVRETHAGVGRAVVFANVALIIGFSVLTLSNFVPLIYFGVLVSLAMLGGMLGNLVLLPVLLRWIPMQH